MAKALGSPMCAVRLDIFSDFQCPGCKAFHEDVLPILIREYVVPGKIFIVSHEFPLNGHQFSREAAYYATAAARIGRYKEVADALFKNQNTWGLNGKVWDTVAGVLTPTEQKKVLELTKDPKIVAEVQQDVQAGTMARVNETPTVEISRAGKTYAFPGPSVQNYPLMKSLIDGLLK